MTTKLSEVKGPVGWQAKISNETSISESDNLPA